MATNENDKPEAAGGMDKLIDITAGNRPGEISVQYLNLRAEGTKGGLLIKDLSIILGNPVPKQK